MTGDIVRAVIPAGKYAGTHTGRVVVRARGKFQVGTVGDVNYKYCQIIQRSDGYDHAR